MKPVVCKIEIPSGRRVICISDIHGSYDLFCALLEKAGYCETDMLILLGDLYTKGTQGRQTLSYIMELARREGVYVLRGNCDWLEDWLTDAQRDFLETLPHIIDSGDYIFVHGGIESMDFQNLDANACMKNDSFMEKSRGFEKWVVTGHWPVHNYRHALCCNAPLVEENKRIIAIDGGNVVCAHGQLNAFIIHNGSFSHAAVNPHGSYTVPHTQKASGGLLNITYLDRFVEILRQGELFSLVRHLATGRTLDVPNWSLWRDGQGRLGAGSGATDYFLPLEAGEEVSLIRRFENRLLLLKDGTVGWYEE